MGLNATLAGLGGAAALFVVGLLLARRPYEPGRLPLVPPVAIQFVALTVVLVMLAHLVSLLTGRPLTGRFGP